MLEGHKSLEIVRAAPMGNWSKRYLHQIKTIWGVKKKENKMPLWLQISIIIFNIYLYDKKNTFSIQSNLETILFKIDLPQKTDRHKGVKSLNYGSQYPNDQQ